jgi:multidrug efflux pump
MPLVSVAAVVSFVVFTFGFYGQNNNGVEFFVDSEPEQAIVYVRARGNLSLAEKDALVKRAEDIVLQQPGILNAFAFSGEGGLNNNTGGAEAPKDTIGQVQLETIPWEDRPAYARETGVPLEDLDGDVIIDTLTAKLQEIPGIEVEILAQARGPASGKPLHLRLKGDNWEDLVRATEEAHARFSATPGLTLVEDTLPLPGIDWQIDVDVEKAGRYGADVATVGAMIQLVTRGILLDTMRVDSSDEEIEIRVRFPEEYRVLSTLDTLKVRTMDGLVPLSNFMTRTPVEKLAEINRIDQKRYFDVKADVAAGLMRFTEGTGPNAKLIATGYGEGANVPAGMTAFTLGDKTYQVAPSDVAALNAVDDLHAAPVTANERISVLTDWLESAPFANGIEWEWTGDQEDQAESEAFLQSAFAGALGLMFIILLAQFNSFYNSVLVLLAVVMSVAGVLWGMIILDQYFSIIMTGTGIVALAGIVVNNNIVLIDTYQEYARYMPRIEAIIRTAEDRIRPVLLTTITTMAGLAPMMFGLSLDFFAGGYSIDSPTALWWKNLATAVVFGLGIATVLTLVFTPSMLAIRVWATSYVLWFARLLAKLSFGRGSRVARDWALTRAARRVKSAEIIWEDLDDPEAPKQMEFPLKAAE